MSSKKIKVVPMNHAEKCPVCSGFGTVSKNKIQCHACSGEGYVFVPNFTDEYLAMTSSSLKIIQEVEDEK